MTQIMLPIHKKYNDLIFDGTKQFEFRKRLVNERIDNIEIYETAPTSKIVGQVSVLGTLSGPPEEVWELTKERAGISEKAFFDYFKNKETAHAYILDKAQRYDRPKSLSHYKMTAPPQAAVYLKHKK